MARTRKQIMDDLRKLRSELRKADDAVLRETCMTGIDDLLDERLDQKGAHPADCDCADCLAAVADLLAARVAAEDVASVGEWGPLGVVPE